MKWDPPVGAETRPTKAVAPPGGPDTASRTELPPRHRCRSSRQSSSLDRTRYSHGKLLDTLLTPRFGTRKLAELGGTDLSLLDADLAADGLKPSTRRNVHVVFRSVLRTAVEGGLLAALPPRLPRLPKVGRM